MKDFLNSKFFVVMIIFILVIIAYSSVFFLGKNNPIELEIEKVIETETGLKIDLTP